MRQRTLLSAAHEDNTKEAWHAHFSAASEDESLADFVGTADCGRILHVAPLACLLVAWPSQEACLPTLVEVDFADAEGVEGISHTSVS